MCVCFCTIFLSSFSTFPSLSLVLSSLASSSVLSGLILLTCACCGLPRLLFLSRFVCSSWSLYVALVSHSHTQRAHARTTRHTRTCQTLDYLSWLSSSHLRQLSQDPVSCLLLALTRFRILLLCPTAVFVATLVLLLSCASASLPNVLTHSPFTHRAQVNIWTINEPWLFSITWCLGANSVTTCSCLSFSLTLARAFL